MAVGGRAALWEAQRHPWLVPTRCQGPLPCQCDNEMSPDSSSRLSLGGRTLHPGRGANSPPKEVTSPHSCSGGARTLPGSWGALGGPERSWALPQGSPGGLVSVLSSPVPKPPPGPPTLTVGSVSRLRGSAGNAPLKVSFARMEGVRLPPGYSRQ